MLLRPWKSIGILRQTSNRSKGSKAVGLEFRGRVFVAVADGLGGGRLGQARLLSAGKLMTLSLEAVTSTSYILDALLVIEVSLPERPVSSVLEMPASNSKRKQAHSRRLSILRSMRGQAVCSSLAMLSVDRDTLPIRRQERQQERQLKPEIQIV